MGLSSVSCAPCTTRIRVEFLQSIEPYQTTYQSDEPDHGADDADESTMSSGPKAVDVLEPALELSVGRAVLLDKAAEKDAGEAAATHRVLSVLRQKDFVVHRHIRYLLLVCVLANFHDLLYNTDRERTALSATLFRVLPVVSRCMHPGPWKLPQMLVPRVGKI